MEEIIAALLKYGGTVFMAGLFVYLFITEQKEKKEEKNNNNAVLKELSNSNQNIAESLNLLKTSIDTNAAEYRQHDDRAIQQFNTINEKLTEIKEKLSK